MMVRPDTQLRTIIRAMTEVVLPAVDPANQMAQEQARVVVGALLLMAERLPLQFQFDRDELQRLTDFAEQLAGVASGGPRTSDLIIRLAADARAGRDVLERAKADPAELVDTVRQLRAVAGAVVDTVFADDAAASCRDAVWHAVLTMSRDQLLRERAWVLPQGFEQDPSSLPSLDSLLGTAAATG